MGRVRLDGSRAWRAGVQSVTRWVSADLPQRSTSSVVSARKTRSGGMATSTIARIVSPSVTARAARFFDSVVILSPDHQFLNRGRRRVSTSYEYLPLS